MAYTDDGKNTMLDHLGTQIDYVALLENGTEISGGNYERQEVNWNSATDGEITASNDPVFDVPGGTTITGVAFYDSLTDGTNYAETTVVEESYTQEGTYTLTSIQLDLNK